MEIPKRDISLILDLFEDIEKKTSFKKSQFITPPKHLPNSENQFGWRIEFKSNPKLYFEFEFMTSNKVKCTFFPNRNLKKHSNISQVINNDNTSTISKPVLKWLEYIESQYKAEIEFATYFETDSSNSPFTEENNNEQKWSELMTPLQINLTQTVLTKLEQELLIKGVVKEELEKQLKPIHEKLKDNPRQEILRDIKSAVIGLLVQQGIDLATQTDFITLLNHVLYLVYEPVNTLNVMIGKLFSSGLILP